MLQSAIGEKVPTCIMTIFMAIGGFCVAYLRGWLMSLVVTSMVPLLAIAALSYAFVL